MGNGEPSMRLANCKAPIELQASQVTVPDLQCPGMDPPWHQLMKCSRCLPSKSVRCSSPCQSGDPSLMFLCLCALSRTGWSSTAMYRSVAFCWMVPSMLPAVKSLPLGSVRNLCSDLWGPCLRKYSLESCAKAWFLPSFSERSCAPCSWASCNSARNEWSCHRRSECCSWLHSGSLCWCSHS